MVEEKIILSSLPKTWIIDIDGTIAIHNGYKNNGKDTALEASRKFFSKIPDQDYIVLVTSRDKKYQKITESFLIKEGFRFNQILYNLPTGERILINDRKPSGLDTAYAINLERDKGIECIVCIDNMK